MPHHVIVTIMQIAERSNEPETSHPKVSVAVRESTVVQWTYSPIYLNIADRGMFYASSADLRGLLNYSQDSKLFRKLLTDDGTGLTLTPLADLTYCQPRSPSATWAAAA